MGIVEFELAGATALLGDPDMGGIVLFDMGLDLLFALSTVLSDPMSETLQLGGPADG